MSKRIDTSALKEDSLDDIFGADGVNFSEIAVGAEPSYFERLPVAWIVERSPVQTRAPFDPDTNENDAELVESVRENGVIQPVLLVAIENDIDSGEPRYRIVAGHRRLDASIAAEHETIRSLVVPPGTSDEELESFTFIENFHRSDPSDIEMAELVKLLIERHKWSQQAAADTLRIGVGTVNRYMSLANADQQIRDLSAAGDIGLASAKKLSGLPESQLPSAIDAIKNRGLTVTDAVDLASNGDLRKSTANTPKAPKIKTAKKNQVVPDDFVIAVLGKDASARFYKALANDTYFQSISPDARCAVAVLAIVGDGKWKATSQRFADMGRSSQNVLTRCVAGLRKLYNLQKARKDTVDAADILKALDIATAHLAADIDTGEQDEQS